METLELDPAVSRSPLCALLFLMTLVAACNDKAAKSVVATPHGTRVEVAGGAYTKVAPQELQTLLASKTFPLINVHTPYEGEIEKTDAVIPYNEIDKIVDKLPSDKNAMVVLYCRSGPMSQKATETLVKLGYTNVWKLDRGMVGWPSPAAPPTVSGATSASPLTANWRGQLRVGKHRKGNAERENVSSPAFT
jgi:rhodanese-related sulfurtransferase